MCCGEGLLDAYGEGVVCLYEVIGLSCLSSAVVSDGLLDELVELLLSVVNADFTVCKERFDIGVGIA